MARASVSTSRAASPGGSGVPSSFLSRLPPSTELQREERPALVLADLVDLDDVRVLQAGDRLGLRPEAGQLAVSRREPPARIIFRATKRFSPTCRAL